jgi:hypothetical protein
MPADATDYATIAKPFLLLAAIAFILGFLVTVMVAAPRATAAGDHAQPVAVSGPASAEWNLPKQI